MGSITANRFLGARSEGGGPYRGTNLADMGIGPMIAGGCPRKRRRRRRTALGHGRCFRIRSAWRIAVCAGGAAAQPHITAFLKIGVRKRRDPK